MIKLSDYVFEYLSKMGVHDVFVVTGGGAMHLNDALGRNDKINYYCFAHEQGAAIAAEGYARISGNMAVCNVTSGPGGTNCLTGVIGQWLDSVPVLYLSGQIKRETMVSNYPGLHLRQLGDQEINIVEIVKSVTKYAHCVTDPTSVRYHLEQALHLATSGRPGPVWLDIPLDVQAAMLDREKLVGFIPHDTPLAHECLNKAIDDIIDKLNVAKKPLILVGNGVRSSGAVDDFRKWITQTDIPVVTSFLGADIIPTTHPHFIGRVGTIGSRAGNFALQSCDLLLCIGTRNNIRQTGYNFADFARNAEIIAVDIDESELVKPTVRTDYPLVMDAGEFVRKVSARNLLLNNAVWLAACCRLREQLADEPRVLEESKCIEPYYFMEALSGMLCEDAIVVTANATPSIIGYQAATIRELQRYLWNSGCAAMGYDLPAAIGASLACSSERQVICLTGDGSVQMNIQELQTIAQYRLPIKIFVLQNDGYVSIKQTQDNLFAGRRVGSSSATGVGHPNFAKIAEAYGIKGVAIDGSDDWVAQLKSVLNECDAVLCTVNLPAEYIFSPKCASEKLPDGRIVSKPLEDMFPFLPRNEYKMILDSIENIAGEV